MRILAAICAALMSLGLVLAAPQAANAAVPGSQSSCSNGHGGTGTVQALAGGRTMYLAHGKTGGYLPATKKAYTKVYTPTGNLMWEIDYRENAATTLTKYTFNRDSQVHRSGYYIATTFRWIITGGTDKSCTAWSRIP